MRYIKIDLPACSVVLVAFVQFSMLSLLFPAEAAERMCDLAHASTRPQGAPKASDVIMRSLGLHPRNKRDPHDTMQALKDFHATTLAWAYITNSAFIDRVKASGRVFGGAAAAPSYHKANKKEGWFDEVVIVNLTGEPIIAPWKRTWKRTLWGCVNSPELERGYVEYLKRYIDAGAQIMQRDEPGANFNATRWGGCFCEHCVKSFREYLAANTTPQKRQELGIGDIETFDYREHLREAEAPVGDPFGGWNGGELKELFVQFQTDVTVEFHRRTRRALDKYAGRRVPFSCNNGVHRWSDIELGFDWTFGELSYSRATAHYLYGAMQDAAKHDRQQIVTMPKKSNYNNPAEWERRTRQTIAMAYACGGHCMVPWDVYLPRDAPRYFGKPEQYADLFGFIRANRRYFDGYEQAAAGYGVPEQSVAARIVGGGNVSAIVRAVPGDAESAIVVHLVDWSERPKPFTLTVDPIRLFGDRPLRFRLLLPRVYEKHEHGAAEETGDYGALSEATPLAQGHVASVAIPALRPWGIVVVEPDATEREGVWQPGIWADEDTYYHDPLIVAMDCASRGAVVRYTTDGTEPVPTSEQYVKPFALARTATVKGRAFLDDRASSTATASFTSIEGSPAPIRPGGGALDPALRLWLKADTLATELHDGDPVQMWMSAAGPDAASRPIRLYSGMASAPPTFGAKVMNGRPAIRFDGIDDHLAIQGFSNDHLADTAFTIFMVTQSSMPGFGICGNGLNGGGGRPRLYLTRSSFRYDVLDKGLSPRVPDDAPAISTFMHDGQETISAYVNGKSKGRLSGLPVVPEFGGGNLAMPFWGGNKNHAGDIAEIIAFDRALADDEREGVEAYLSEKYQIRYRRRWR